MATTTNNLPHPRLVSIAYTWQGEHRRRCFRVIEGELSATECAATKARTGIGDVVAGATKAVGVKPCGGCKARQAALNKATPGWLTKALGWLRT